ncbi:unnamed protein product [Hymenolepis diminuta]|uniref:Uncharacterized protein n=1 Tax=Hymenolepis diminuta TaxID=6216 RepID=A0A564Z0Z2_HYMDI|nr:unnamed protein product [Hymenolepis diminuta]
MLLSYQLLRFPLNFLPQHAHLSTSLSLASILVVASLNMFGLINYWCSVPQLLLVLTKIVTSYELVTVIAVVIFYLQTVCCHLTYNTSL